MIAIIQSSEELSIIKNRYSELPTILALNLEVATYCKLNGIKFIFPFEKEKYDDITKKILLASKNLLENIDFKDIKYNFLINDIKAILRFKFNQTAFLLETISQIANKYEKIIYTNYFSDAKYWFEKNYVNIDDAIKILNPKNLEKLHCQKKVYSQMGQDLYTYKIEGLKYKEKKKLYLIMLDIILRE